MVMKKMEMIWACGLVTVLMASLPAAGRDVSEDHFVRIDRSSTLESGDLDCDSQQRIAHLIGYGDYFVRTVRICDSDSTLCHARVFYVFPSRDALRRNDPVNRVFCYGNAAEAKINIGGDGDLVNNFLGLISSQLWDEKTLCKGIPEILTAVIYGNKAALLCSNFKKLADTELGKIIVCDSAKRAELRALCRDPLVSYDADGGYVWEGRFALCDGGIEDVTLSLSSRRDHLVALKRMQVRARNYFRNDIGDVADAEEWAVSNESNWHPPKRLSFTLTLATLGNTKAKFQLGNALLEEYDEYAKAEGIKWLRSAAADGYEDALTRLAQMDADPRPGRDREAVRKDNCCRIPSK